jgi:hypothetical protein
LAVRVLVEGSEADEVVIAEELDLLTGFFEQNVFCGQRVNAKYLRFHQFKLFTVLKHDRPWTAYAFLHLWD